MNLPFLIVSALLGVVTLICARAFVFYIKKERFDKEERVILPISIVFFITFGIGVCFALSRQNLFYEVSDTLPIYTIIAAFAFVFGLIMNGAYKTPGRLTVFAGLSLGIAIGMIIFYNYFIGLAVVSITLPLSYIVTRYIQPVKNNI
jgi:hypothetical protein